jgi:4-amino-4-deoxy-L-arabinose transferase-like glycosyltransferase
VPRVGLVMLLFLAGLLPLAAHFVAHHPDERHYTDAALWMLHSGDYLVPHRADGAHRFEKPILTYWVVAASYALLGVSPLASRLPFLLAAGGIIWLTYWLALRLSGRPAVAALAALLMLCHPLLIISATRSIPDVLLCLFVLLSANGFLGLLLEQRPGTGHHLAAYGGAGLAVVTKGLPVLLLVGFAWTFAMLNPWHRVPLRRLLNWPSIVLGAVTGGSWFLVVALLHGSTPLDTFWYDQVTVRVTADPGQVPRQLARALACFVLTLLPWSLLLVPVAWQRAKLAPADDRFLQGRRFILLWALVVAVLISTTSKFSVRYVLLVSPLLAVVVADLLVRAAPQSLALWTKASLAVVGIVLLAIEALGAMVQVQMHVGYLEMAGLVGLSGVTLLLAAVGLRGGWASATTSLAVSMFLLVPATLLALRSLVLPDQGTQIARNLARAGHLESALIRFLGPAPLASKVRVCSGGRAKLYQAGPARPDREVRTSVLIVRADQRGSIDVESRVVQPISQGYRDMPPNELAWAIWQGTLREYLDEHREEFQLVIAPVPEFPGSAALEDAELSSAR